MSTYVLVHGAWHGGWCWHKVVAALEGRGHVVHAPDLPGHGVDTTPLNEVSLDAYVERIGQVLERCDERAILVGHSMGGLVITQTAERFADRLHKLFYLCAMMYPPSGKLSEEPLKGSGVTKAIRPTENGLATTVLDSQLKPLFYDDCSDADIALARLCLVPQRMDITLAKLTHTVSGWGALPRDYILCKQDQAILDAGQRVMINETGCDAVHEMNTSHSPFFSAPEALADILEA